MKASEISQVKGRMVFFCNNKVKHIVRPEITKESEGLDNDFVKMAFIDPS